MVRSLLISSEAALQNTMPLTGKESGVLYRMRGEKGGVLVQSFLCSLAKPGESAWLSLSPVSLTSHDGFCLIFRYK